MTVTRMEPLVPADNKELTDLATDLVAKATAWRQGYLASSTTRSPVRLAFPPDAVDRWFPPDCTSLGKYDGHR